ncbi:hypothetical protein AAFN88_05125 [Pelagibius sp. CAU 1746]|uniref:hypothetical protein n=1 Tax=Pelagibius sp. CAU 1746 TaxID=3140370 RepID=UPI00325B51CC
MHFEAFRSSLAEAAPPVGQPPLLAALWHAAKGNWDTAHGIAQDDGSAEGAWVHAHLHRVEGDESNAGYWYQRAGKPHCRLSLEEEWAELAQALLHGAPL